MFFILVFILCSILAICIYKNKLLCILFILVGVISYGLAYYISSRFMNMDNLNHNYKYIEETTLTRR